MSKNDDDSWLSQAATKLDLLKVKQDDGNVGFQMWNDEGIEFEDLVAIVGTHYRFDTVIPDVERIGIIRQAITESAKAREITGASLRRNICKLTTAFKDRPLNDFFVITSLSVKRPPDLECISFDDMTFDFFDGMPDGFSRDGARLYEEFRPPRDLPKDFTVTRVEVQARTEAEAFDRALFYLDFLRGIWNWITGPTRMTYAPLPINPILLGPVHTVHSSTGQSSHNYQYEPFYRHETKAHEFRDWRGVKENQEDIFNLLGRHAYRPFMVESLVRYARSLDTGDHESSFLKIWSVLEYLAVCKEDENYKDLTRRILFFIEDREYHRQILEHLRRRRNGVVHRGESTLEMQTFVYQAKRYAEWLIRYHLRSGTTFNSPLKFAPVVL